MPTYKTPRHGVTLSEAFHEAANVAPIDIVILHTFELFHPVLPDGPIYVVNNFEDLLATKEADADRDAGLEVEFMAATVGIQRPTESDQAQAGELELVVGNVSGVFSRALRSARGSPDQWEIIERIYDTSDTTGPAQTPMILTVTNVQVENKQVTMRCSFSDPANFSIPRTTFRRLAYPSLVR